MWKIGYQYRRHLDQINAIDIDATELRLATASNDNCVGILDLNTQEIHFLQGHTDYIEDVAFGPDLSIVASASRDTTCVLWNTKLSERVGVLRGHKKTVRCISWSPDFKHIVTGSNDHTAFIWDVTESCRCGIITGMKGWVRDIEWKDNTIALAGNDKNILLYDLRNKQVVQSIETKSSSDITSISFHHSGSMIAGGGFDQALRIWDLRTSSLIRKQKAHSDVLTHVAFSPLSDDVMTVGLDGIARIWNVKCPDSIASFHQHDEGITSCCWYKNGKGFITVGKDRKIVGIEYHKKEEEGKGEEEDNGHSGNNNLLFDGGDLLASLGRMQNTLALLVNTMKRLDDRLMIQEERVRWLKDNNKAISKAYDRRKPDGLS